ncbi:MAG: hypothetical protein P8X98_07865 [Woeseiaceae bacterium]
MLSLVGIVAGLVLLLLGGAALVGGASQLAARLGVPPMVVGLTIVGFGTSAPELVVNIVGGLRGESALAFGNVVGSNISNLALVLGAAAILQKIEIHGRAQIDQSDAVVLILLFAIFIHITAQDMLLARQSDALFDEVADYPLVKSGAKRRFLWAYIVAGFVLLFIGGELTVRYASAFAVHVGLSTTVIGLFVVAVGTSLPELVTSVMAAWRRESDLALGNILGSNVFNSLIVLPVSALIDNVAIPEGGVQDLIVSWVLAAVLVPIFYFGNQSLGRISGSLLVIAYFTYAIIRITA